jgi:hypothetical protein
MPPKTLAYSAKDLITTGKKFYNNNSLFRPFGVLFKINSFGSKTITSTGGLF